MNLKFTILFCCVFFSQVTHAQIFEEVPRSDFRGVSGDFDFADVDGDGDQDVLLIGRDEHTDEIAVLYLNDGTGNFSEVNNTPFPEVRSSTVDFADIDGDNDQDVLITGLGNDKITKLYVNDGLGNFSEVSNTPFEAVSNGAVTFADVDGDNDLDVLITGAGQSGKIAKLYTNDGMGNFNEVSDTPFESVSSSSVDFADIDGDNDQDVIITGTSNSSSRSTTLYTNDGLGNFTEVSETPFQDIYRGSVAFVDVDGDNDQDVLLTGGIGTATGFARLYINDGIGNFSEASSVVFEPLNHSAIVVADVDGDNDPDVLMTGEDSSFDRSAFLYVNDGTGNFSQSDETCFMGVLGAVAFADINGDGDQDALIVGGNSTADLTGVLYDNDGTGVFERVGIPFEDVYSGAVAFADIDGDGDEDVLVTGDNHYNVPIAKLYKNDGAGIFSEVKNTPFEGLWWGSVAFADVDGDDDLDVLLSGHITHDPSSVATKLYLNDGLGNFTIVPNTSFEGVTESSIAFADIDNDGDLDVLLAGRNDSYDESTKLYTNDGMGNFSEVANTPFQAVRYSSIAFADIDGDNDQDVLITGEYSFDDYTKLYLNDGAGNFSETFTSMQAVSYGSVAFADVDGDNDQDVLITGRFGTNEVAKLYTNNGSGNFTEVSDTPFYAVYRSSIDFADVDDDGDQDVLIVGGEGFSDSVAKLYINDGTGNFSEASDEPFRGVERASMAFADIDGDGSLDVIITGNDYSDIVTSLYRNTTEVVSNESPIPLEHQIVRVYPNPSTNGVCNIEYSSDSNTKLLINVFDAMGKLVLYQSAVAKSGLNNFQLDFTALNKGIYIIQMKDEKGVSTLKLINQ